MHLALAEEQALALSRGELEHQSLQAIAGGSLGNSLQAAVTTLTKSVQQREEFRQNLAHEASHDGLTGLINRNASLTYLKKGLARSRRSGTEIAVLFVDLDGFKQVNDSLGHQAGDHVLTTVAQRFVSMLREGDQAGRLGGDEFVVIAEPIDGLVEAIGLAERLVAEVAKPIVIDGAVVPVGASIGVAISNGGELSAEELLRDADMAVYRAKELGAGRVEICDASLREEVLHQVGELAMLRHALESDELLIHYQAIVSRESGAIDALEAFVRWDRPGRGLLAAASFIEGAEQSGLIVDIDRWVLDNVLAQMAAWASEPALRNLPVSVNVSAKCLGRKDFASRIREALSSAGVAPERLIVDVTEDSLLTDLAAATGHLQQLRDMGVRVAIDDFGTGYTSLAHLQKLPVDILKIDPSFVSDVAVNPVSKALVGMIVETGHLLGAVVLAEGVETTEQAEAIGKLGGDEMQGHLFSRPMSADEMREVLSAEASLRPPAKLL